MNIEDLYQISGENGLVTKLEKVKFTPYYLQLIPDSSNSEQDNFIQIGWNKIFRRSSIWLHNKRKGRVQKRTNRFYWTKKKSRFEPFLKQKSKNKIL